VKRCFSKYATVEYVTAQSINIYSHRKTALFQNNWGVQSIIIQNNRELLWNIRTVTRGAKNV
jgi:hypothetical protein